MDEDYRNYMSYIFGTNKDIEDVLLPYSQKINKYDFISRTSRLYAFAPINKQKSIIMIEKAFNGVFDTLLYDDVIAHLYEDVKKQLEKQKIQYDYDVMSDILIKMSIIIENCYLCENDEEVTYKTLSFDIDDVLSFIEMQIGKGIKKYGYDSEQGSYNFYDSMCNILNVMRSERASYIMINREVTGLELAKKIFYIIYFEILLLVANTYNNHIKELYCNEW